MWKAVRHAGCNPAQVRQGPVLTMGGVHTPRVSVFAPAPILTVTIEEQDGEDAIHLHPGGQGLWVAHMAAALGAEAVLCAPFGGEAGRVIQGLLEGEPLEVRTTHCDEPNGAYVHDRRSGERVELAATPSPRQPS